MTSFITARSPRGKLFSLGINPDFETLLPALTEAEFAQLKANVLADPEHDVMPPVFVWDSADTVVDGHNQLRLRQKNSLAVRIKRLNFQSRDDAMLFALRCQLGRRNLSESQRAAAVAMLPRFSNGGDRRSDQSANLQTETTVDDLAKMAGVSPRTMASAAKVADKAVPAIAAGVKEGRFKVSDAATVVNLPADVQQQIAEKAIKDGVTLNKAAQPSAGISFDPGELELAIAATPIKPPKNGQSVVDGKECQIALALLSKLVRSMKKLGLCNKHGNQLSEMIRDVRKLGGMTPLPVRSNPAVR